MLTPDKLATTRNGKKIGTTEIIPTWNELTTYPNLAVAVQMLAACRSTLIPKYIDVTKYSNQTPDPPPPPESSLVCVHPRFRSDIRSQSQSLHTSNIK